MALVLPEKRPVLTITNGDFAPEEAGDEFSPQLKKAREHLRRAIRAVARVEMADSSAPFMGTAFAVGPNLYATASYVGEVIEKSLRGTEGEAVAWIDTNDTPTARSSKSPILRVHLVHPHWQVSFLEVEGTAQPLTFATSDMRTEIQGRGICVVGYPAMDVRNKPEELQVVFGDIWGEKRLMPGIARGMMMSGPENTHMLEHDASTTGGTGGAPLIDLATGLVVGMQHSGSYLQGNFAVPGWELRRDPQWSWLWCGESAAPSAPAESQTPQRIETPMEVFSFDEITELNQIVVASGVATEDDINALFAGLPPGFLAMLPTAAKAGDRLRLGLIQMNREQIAFNGRPPLYYVIRNATLRRSFDATYEKSLEPFLSKLKAAPAAARRSASKE
ncbi:trypsin-like peptidase domain-containing protein [Sinorhizobium sp. M4_45]|uniref:trypsin-like peptidase domain-containing protein n=1 Tax=Sinorhizobium sp. M4_45 TaxID=2037901 RepID=UPI000C9B41A5|nr:trypsin-like peptidase domain-containing protein [Sinorhizobium sp. M4_45]PND27623.1 hypothetical protein CN933_05715 [Sinorhizobium sp. M4_45]